MLATCELHNLRGLSSATPMGDWNAPLAWRRPQQVHSRSGDDRRRKCKAMPWSPCCLFRKGFIRQGFICVSSLTRRQLGSHGPTAAPLREAWAHWDPCPVGSHGPSPGGPRREPDPSVRAIAPFQIHRERVRPSLLRPQRAGQSHTPVLFKTPVLPPFFHISSAGIISGSGSCTPPLSPGANLPASSVRNDDRAKQGEMIPGSGVSPLPCKCPSSKALFSTLTPFSEAGLLAARGVARPERDPRQISEDETSLFGSARLDLPRYG